MTVPACKECNSVLNDRILDFDGRLTYLMDHYGRKRKSALYTNRIHEVARLQSKLEALRWVRETT